MLKGGAIVFLLFGYVLNALAMCDGYLSKKELILKSRLSVKDFKSGYTVNGVVFHGTSIDAALSILREQKIRFKLGSSESLFATPGYDYAAIHAFNYNGSNGVVIPFRFQDIELESLLIVNFDELENKGVTLSDLEDAHVDIAIRGAAYDFHPVFTNGSKVIILNTHILRYPTPLELLELSAERIAKSEEKVPGQTHVIILEAYEKLYRKIEGDKSKLPSPMALLKDRVRSPQLLEMSERYD